MKDSWKEHIESRRTDFELHHTDEGSLWEGISQRLDQREQKQYRWVAYLWKSAALLVIALGVSWWLVLKPYSQSEQRLYRLTPGLAEAESFYMQQINQKMEIIEANEDEVDPVLMENIEQLDAAYQELRQDLKDHADNEEVVRAMIEHQRLKLEILEAILLEIESQNIQHHDTQL